MRFERGQDAKKAVGVGLYGMHKFDTDEEAADFIISIIPTILDIHSIHDLPDSGFIYKGTPGYEKMVKYTVDCIRVKEGAFRVPTYIAPDESLLWMISQKIDDRKILRKLLKMAEEKGYEIRKR